MILKPDQILSGPTMYPLPSQFNVEEARTREQSIRTVLNQNTAYRVYTKIFKIYLSFVTVIDILLLVIAIGILSSPHEFVRSPEGRESLSLYPSHDGHDGHVRNEREQEKLDEMYRLMPLALCYIAYLTLNVVIGWVGVYSLNTIWLKVYLALDVFEWFIVLIGNLVSGEYSRLWALILTTLSGGLAFGIIRQVSKTVENLNQYQPRTPVFG